MMANHGGQALAHAIERAYEQGETDYYLKPLVRVDHSGMPVGKIRPGDSVVFCCRRGEREIEMTEMFTDPHFSKVDRRFLPDLDFSILTLYHEKFAALPVAFPPLQVQKTLAQCVSGAGKTQLHCAESEKFAHVTFFLNGGHNAPFPGEDDICIPSPKGVPFDTAPGLSLEKVADTALERLGQYDLIAVNFANGDVIGHTANRTAKLEASAHVSRHLERLVPAALAKGYGVLITADHGNIETLLTPAGTPHVAHTKSPVHTMLLTPEAPEGLPLSGHALCDVAPTVLRLMGIPKPEEMTGQPMADVSREMPVLLVILDGWGKGSDDENDVLHLADIPYWKQLVSRCNHTLLHASGTHVGLGDGKPGNSEAGHMNLGAGRVVLQDDQRIDRAIAEGTFANNPVFLRQVKRVRERQSALHLIAYLTHASSHGAIAYAAALCKLAHDTDQVYLHIIVDGRSTEPGSAPALVLELENTLEGTTAQIVDATGRGYVLDRDGNYDKVKLAYDAMVLGAGTPYTAE